MQRPRVGSVKLLCAVLLACYGILAVIATGPHPHDWQAIASAEFSSRTAVPLEVSGSTSEDASGHGQRVTHCMLCAWSRSTARPAFSARMIEVEPPRVAARPILIETFVDIPSEATALLRAPPQA